MVSCTFNGVTLTLLRGSIVDVTVDAIVNAANAGLAGGGGVDGAIHRAGGPDIMQACRQIGGCPTGSAVATTAGNLKAHYIFHAVGPVYHQRGDEEKLLTSTYQKCLDLAEQYQIHSIAFPAISTGAYRYPLKPATTIALQTTIEHIKKSTSLQAVLFVLFDTHTLEVYEQTLTQLMQQ